jgi:hypothetical protein
VAQGEGPEFKSQHCKKSWAGQGSVNFTTKQINININSFEALLIFLKMKI